ncbi:phage holin [Psychrobacillus psychrodurans]|uniref:phage holin n=1 Tax=Psychrobacillus psychrodurans TaxID=126157 RepID=UPI001F4F1083|nr:phage holin [Psychrobacillus psychrodurans]MCK1999391.1 phage holin [Psychrobacillus psychrodurans]
MKINWKVRFKHKPFLIALFALVMLLVQQVASFFGVDTTIYNEQVTNLFNTALAILVLLGVVSDPTTDGLSDSQQAMRYHKPRDGVK